MKLVIDMNLSPAWVRFLDTHGIEAVHWSTVGDPRAEDEIIMQWARDRGYVVFTHHLDFSALLVATRKSGPSVLQVRTQNVLPDAIGSEVVDVLQTYTEPLVQGAIVTMDKLRSRVRILPIER